MSAARDPEQIEGEIEQTRAELGDTVEALAQKADVKAQAKRKVDETKASVADRLGKAKDASPDAAVSAVSGASRRAQSNPLPLAALGTFAVGFLAGRLSKR
jgi:ElaB/YqjD/DUF883 family membrane-anchored ribosome-binding protein